MIGQKVVHSLRWLAIGRFTGQIVTWAATIVVIRLLDPEAYGLMAMAMVTIGFLRLINELGITAGLIQKRLVDRDSVRAIFGLAILVNIGMFLALVSSSYAVARFVFKEPDVQPLLAVLAVDFLLSAFALVPSAKLSREMNFRARAVVDLTTMTVASLTTLALALAGAGVWALVVGHIAGTVSRVVSMNVAARVWIPPSFRIRGVGDLVRFGGIVTLERVLWYFYSQSDVFLIGRILGTKLLGFYSVAMHVATLPMQKISGMLNEVGFAAFARVQDDPKLVASHYLKAVRILASFAVPVFLGISAVAPEIVGVILGEQYLASTVPLTVLALVVPLRMISNLTSPALLGIGRPDVSLFNLVFAAVIMPAAFFVGLQRGLNGVALAWVIAYPIVFAIIHLRTLRVLHVGYFAFVRSVQGPFVSGIVMYACVALVRWAFRGSDVPAVALFPVLVAVGAAAYTACMFFGQRELVRELITLFSRRPGRAES